LNNKKLINRALVDIPFDRAEYSVFDFETTGISARIEKVIEIGIVKIRNGRIVDTFQSYFNPGRQIPYYITQMTGITNEDVKDAPYFDELFNSINEFFGSSVLVAHNLNFDLSFLRKECSEANKNFPNNPAICTVRLAKILYPQLKSRSLGNLTKSLKIKHREIHRGLGDASATAKVLIKMFNQLREEHNIETVSDLVHFQNSPSGSPLKLIKKKLADNYSSVPNNPGIYFFKDGKGSVIYVGKAKSLKKRVSNYFQSNTPKKTRKIIQKAQSLDYHVTNSELIALISEAELIKQHNPQLNTLLKKFSRNYFIRIKKDGTASKVEATTNFEFDGNDYYGPYSNRDTTKSLIDIIDKTFALRECTDKEFNKHKKCYLADIERCLAPCINNDISSEYDIELQKVNDFLCGHNQSSVDRLLNKMKDLSERKKFEEAAQIRDVINSLLMQLNKSSILAEPINKANVLIEISGFKANDYLLLIEGRVFIKDYPLEKNTFNDALDHYFLGSVDLFKKLTDKDLERLKISLAWLIKNKTRIKIHYLSNYHSLEELGREFIFTKESSHYNDTEF